MKLIITDIEDLKIKDNKECELIKPEGPIHNCIGCFGCWIKTPGQCVIKDGYENTGAKIGRCDELIIISKCYYGSVSPFVKAVQDRGISYIHPDFVIYKGEMHHKRRYKNKMRVSAYFYGDDITDDEKALARKLIEANADNYQAIVKNVEFYNDINEIPIIKKQSEAVIYK